MLLRRWVAAGVATAVVDFVWACALTAIYGRTFASLWQGVASVVLGPSALEGGTRTIVIGIAMHVAVAFFWSGVFVLLMLAVLPLRRALESITGVLGIAAIYGPFIWIVMSLLVIPALTSRPPNPGARWWIQLAGHFFFVGLPMVAAARQPGRGR
jgi:hypothetical protein